MFARWLTLVVWALVAGTVVFWALRLFAPVQPVPAQATVAVAGTAAGGDLTRLFGVVAAPVAPVPAAAPPAPPESSRFQLVGLAAPGSRAARSAGVALIALDGKPARAYRVGAVIDGDHVLQDVRGRTVAIGPRNGPALISLELPALPPPATGVPAAATAPAAPLSPQPQQAPTPVLLQPPPGALPPASPLTIQPQPAVPVVPGALPMPGLSPAQARLRALRNAAGAQQVQPQSLSEPEPGGPNSGVEAARR